MTVRRALKLLTPHWEVSIKKNLLMKNPSLVLNYMAGTTKKDIIHYLWLYMGSYLNKDEEKYYMNRIFKKKRVIYEDTN